MYGSRYTTVISKGDNHGDESGVIHARSAGETRMVQLAVDHVVTLVLKKTHIMKRTYNASFMSCRRYDPGIVRVKWAAGYRGMDNQVFSVKHMHLETIKTDYYY